MYFIQGFNRNQLQIMSFNEFVAQNSWVSGLAIHLYGKTNNA